MSFNIDLSDKVVLITGISSGIGNGIAQNYAKANAKIAGCALDPIESECVQRLIKNIKEESGNTPFYLQADVTNCGELENFVGKAADHFGKIDIVASNAGNNIFKGAEFCNYDDWILNIKLNLESHWNLARLCKPYLEKSDNGVIIINSSSHSLNTIKGCFPYNIAKTALKALIQSLTIEWGPSIRTVGVAPGFIDTPLSRGYFNSFPDPSLKRKETEMSYPLKRIGTPDEIGGWFVFLSSQYAAFAGGQTYLIDGGASSQMM